MPIATIAENDRKERFIASAGQTVFPYDFPIYAAEDLQVRRERAGVITILTLGTDYSVTGVQNQTGGNVVLTIGAFAGDIIVILSAMSTARATQFVNGGDLAAAALEAELNRIRILFQQNNRDGRNALLFPPTDPAMQDLPPIALRANRFLAFDGNGQPIAAAPIAGTVLDAVSRLGDNMVGPLGFLPGTADAPGLRPNNQNATGFFSGPNFIGVAINGAEEERFIPGGLQFLPSGIGAGNRTVKAKLRDVFDARDFGVAATDAVDDTAAMQAAINHVQNNGGGVLHLPPGFIFVSSPMMITKSLIIAGAGIGLGSGVGNSGGTVIRSTVAAGNVFTVQSDEAVGFRDFAIDASVTKSANTAGIQFAGATGPGSINRRSKVSNLRITNMYDAIRMDTASDFVVHGCHIQDYTNIGIYSKQTGGVDSGHNVIDSCVIWDLNVGTSQASIRYDKGGDIRVVNSKLLGGIYGARIAIDDGETGTFIFTGNSFEQSIINIRVEQAVAAKNFGNIVIAGNQFSQIIGAGLVGNPQSNISIVAGTPAAPASHWVKNIAIVGNVINNAHNQAVPMIAVQDGEGVTVTGNQGTANGFANPTGLDIAANVGSAKVAGNVFSDTPNGSYVGSTARYQIPATTLEFASGGSTVAAGLTRFLGRANASATQAECLFYLPFKAKVLNLHVNASAAPGVGQSFTYTLQVNGVDTGLTVTVSGNNTDGQNRTQIVLVPSPVGPNTAARVSLKLMTSAGAAPALHQAIMTVVEDD